MAKAKVFWEVNCEEHGTKLQHNGGNFKSVIVPAPAPNKNHRTAGCPICKGDK